MTAGARQRTFRTTSLLTGCRASAAKSVVFQVLGARFSNLPSKPQTPTMRAFPNGNPRFRFVRARDGLRVDDIATELGINKSNASRHLKRAKATGLVSEVDR